jgi:hypothetical protein
MVAAGAANFAAFFAAAVALGGDAVNGCIRDGHYFLAEHGHYTPVSYQVFLYSRWHAYSVFVTQPLALLAGALLTRKPRSANRL